MQTNGEATHQKSLALGNEKISRLILRFASTTFIALLFNALYNLTDTLFVSRGVGDNAMGGVSIVFPFFMIQSAISTAVGGGAASLISRRLGENDPSAGGDIALNAMLTFYITAILTTAVGFAFMNPLLRLMGATEELFPYAKQYFTIILAGNVFSTGFSSIIRAEGRMLYGLLIWVIPISINIVLDAVFILVLGWGVRGAAAATVICQFTSFLMFVLFFCRFSSLQFKGARLKWKRIKEIIAIGLPSLVQMSSLSVIFILVNRALRDLNGTLGLNTFAYLGRILTFAVMPFTALTQALAPVAGYNYGAGKHERVQKAFLFSLLLSFVYALLAILLAETAPALFMRVFTNDTEIIALGAASLRVLAVALIFSPLPFLAGALFQAIGQKLWALLLYGASLVFLIPFLLFLPNKMGIHGVWWSYVIANALTTVLALARLTVFWRKTRSPLNA